MRPRTQFPSDVSDVQFKFFGRFTGKDIARLTVPAAAVRLTTPSLTALAAALLTGIGLYLYRPHDRTIDQHVYHLIRFHVRRWME